MSKVDIVEELKKYTPVGLRVELGDGTAKAVAVARSGNRWSKSAKIIESLDWVRIECLDKDGKVCGVIECDEDDEDDYIDDAAPDANVKLARVMVDVMRCSVREFRSTFEGQMNAMTKLCEAMTSGLASVSESYQQALKVQAAQLTMGAGGGDDDVMKMMQMAMMLKGGGIPPRKEG